MKGETLHQKRTRAGMIGGLQAYTCLVFRLGTEGAAKAEMQRRGRLGGRPRRQNEVAVNQPQELFEIKENTRRRHQPNKALTKMTLAELKRRWRIKRREVMLGKS